MVQDSVISAQHLSKCYQLYAKPIDRLKQYIWGSRKQFYDEFLALNNVSFNIGKGETVGIIGANGSGKSTLLQLISGILTPSTGELAVKGRVTALLELGAGFNPEFTGRDNVYMNAAIMGLSRKETEARFSEIAEFADIGSFMDKPVKTYSSGMYVRLAFSTAINVSPEILLVDEALSVGDIRFQQKCMAKIRDFCDSGTVLFVTHDMAAVTELCNRVIWIDSGRIRLDGAPNYVTDMYLQYMYERDLDPDPNAPEMSSGSPGHSELDGFSDVCGNSNYFGDHRVIIEALRLHSKNINGGVATSGVPFEIGLVLKAHDKIEQPILGYIVKDRLGREIFGDNTLLMRKQLKPFEKNCRYLCYFRFDAWPNLMAGDYVLCLAVADGTMDNHVACHWYHDISVIRSVPVRPPAGIFSIPGTDVELVELDAP